jgi:beta-glucosidase
VGDAGGGVKLPPLLGPHFAALFNTMTTPKESCAKLSLPLKIDMMHGRGWADYKGTNDIDGYDRNTGCGKYCGRTTFRWDNGPQGFADNALGGTSTQWPCQLNIAATFDPALAHAFGVAMGEEWWGKGTNILEGPGVNLMRIPYNGRTFEYMVGEDPVLGAMLVGPTIDGMQLNAMAIAKHLLINSQEYDRHGVNEVVDEKTLRELYSAPFEAAAQHKVSGYMCAYSLINGEHACEQSSVLQRLLREDYKYKGFVVSDWGATHSVAKALTAGLDIEMPEGKWFNEKNLHQALADKEINVSHIDQACEHILTGYSQLPPSRRVPCGPAEHGSCVGNNVSTVEHKALARKIAAESTVLLKNEGNLLPLKKDPKHLTIALVGPEAADPYTAGKGSGGVKNGDRRVTPLMAFLQRMDNVSIIHVPACTGVVTRPLHPGEYTGHPDPHGAAAAAAEADVAIVFASAHATEGWDRTDLGLRPLRCDGKLPEDERSLNNEQFHADAKFMGPAPFKPGKSLKDRLDDKETSSLQLMQKEEEAAGDVSSMYRKPPAATTVAMEDLIMGVAARNKNTIVAMTVPGPVVTPWRDHVKGILCAFLPGEQYGNALADLVFGETMPQARLPVTMPNVENEQRMTMDQYPGVQRRELGMHREATYTEGQIVGYRWYDRHDVQPAFPFGFGLSYAAFTYSNLRVEGRTVAFWVHRTGASGCDTPQLYVSYPTAAEDHTVPVKVLRYFRKTCAAATEVTYTLSARDLSTWDVERGAWVQLTGVFGIHVLAAAQTEGPMCNGPCPALHGSLKVDPSTVPELKPFPPPPSPPEPPPSLPPSPPPPTEEQEEEEKKETKVSTAAPKPAEAGGKHCLTDGQCGKGFHCGASRVCEASGTPAATKTEANAEHKPPAATTTKPAAATTKAPAPKPAGATHCETDGQCSKGFHCGASFVCEAAPTTLIAERAHDLEGRGAKRSLTPA